MAWPLSHPLGCTQGLPASRRFSRVRLRSVENSCEPRGLLVPRAAHTADGRMPACCCRGFRGPHTCVWMCDDSQCHPHNPSGHGSNESEPLCARAGWKTGVLDLSDSHRLPPGTSVTRAGIAKLSLWQLGTSRNQISTKKPAARLWISEVCCRRGK